MSAAPSAPVRAPLKLRPDPHPPSKYGPYRPIPGTSNVLRFPTLGYRAISWIEQNCTFTARQFARRPFKLAAWQKQLIIDLLEQSKYREIDPAGVERIVWRRRYRWALVGIPRKNGKTELLAALALYFLLGEVTEDAPIIVMAAASEKQANALFGAASKMARWSPRLRDRVEALGDEIQVRGREEARILRVSSNPSTTHGLNISVLIADELHVWEPGAGDDLWDTLTSAMSTGTEPLVVAITTAGNDLDTLCGREYQYGRRLENEEIVNPHYFFRWWSAPDGSDYKDPEIHRRANPAYGTFKSRGYLIDRASRMRESSFRRLELNQWTSGAESFLPAGIWDACKLAPEMNDEGRELLAAVSLKAVRLALAAKVDPENEQARRDEMEAKTDAEIVAHALEGGLIPGAPMFIGLDASLVSDATAAVAVQPQTIAGVERVRVKGWVWERPEDPKTRRPVADWLMPFDEVGRSGHRWSVTSVLWALKRWFNVVTVAYDRQFIAWEAEKLFTAGMPMLGITQNAVGIEQGSQSLMEAAMKRRIAHDGDKVLARHIDNASAVSRRRGSAVFRLEKGSRRARMDAAMACVMAIWAMLHPPEVPKPAKKASVFVFADDE